jgi:hypothetical protein
VSIEKTPYMRYYKNVIQILLFLRFRTQLKRSRDERFLDMETALFKAFETAGGAVTDKERVIEASFDEKSLGLWINIIGALESGYNLLKKNAPAILGSYVFVIGKDILEEEFETVCRKLASMHSASGMWCTAEMSRSARFYCSFENRDFAIKAGSNGFYEQIKHIENVPRTIRRSASVFPLSDQIVQTIRQYPHRNIIFSGPEFAGKREGVHRFCASLKNTPPLILSFRSNANIGAFADILSPKIHHFLSGSSDRKKLELADNLRALIFRERLRDEYTSALINTIKRFFRILLELYIAEAKARESFAALILENLQCLDPFVERIFMDIYPLFKYEIIIYGTLSLKKNDEIPQNRHILSIFQKNIILNQDAGRQSSDVKEMPSDLLEMAYAFALLRNYFPGYMFPHLFEESGKNPALLIRVFVLLTQSGIVDFIDDPVPRIPNFVELAEKTLGNRKQLVYDFVKTCLFSAVGRGSLSPCFNLIETLAGFNETVSDALIWNALHIDVLNGTCEKINKIIAENRLIALVGAQRGSVIRYLFHTFSALVHGNEELIQKAFTIKEPQTASSLFQAQTLINRACYHLALREDVPAFEKLKETMRLNQEQQQANPAKVFRLIALVKLLRGKLTDAADYLAIAVDYAEKQKAVDELAISAYYEANIQYLLGNLSKAERFAHNAEHNAIISGCHSWADRARFLRGKLRFEFGFYQDALHIFERTRENLTEPVADMVKNTLNAWIFRAGFFSKIAESDSADQSALNTSFHTNFSPDSCLDMLLFKIEAAYLSEDYKATLRLSETLLKNIDEHAPDNDFLWTERPDWRSGFAQGELLNMKESVFWKRQALVFHSLALCKLTDDPAEKKRALDELDWLSVNKVLSNTDTNDAFYFYALSVLTKESGASLIDTNTVAGIAYKRLQERSLKIDAPEARKAFLSRPYWNNALIADAKEYKLI